MATAKAKYAQIKALLATAGARMINIKFRKVPKPGETIGEERSLTFNPKAAPKRVKGEAASKSAQQAAKTRSENNPNLINVWDHAKQGFRSINMDTIYQIVIDGTVFDLS